MPGLTLGLLWAVAGMVDATFTNRVEAIVVERELPGMAVVVMDADRVVYAEGLGVADLATEEPVTADTVFQLGSISKQFLAAFVVDLEDAGRLSLDAPLRRHLPDFDQLPADLRLHDLLDHTSGIREPLFEADFAEGVEDLERSTAEMLFLLRRLPTDFPPGERWSYSNANYLLLAQLVEWMTGMPYEQALAERFFEPLGLSSLGACPSVPEGADEARGYRLGTDGPEPAPLENMAWLRGDGGLCGSARDVARWLRALDSGEALSDRARDRLWQRRTLADGTRLDYANGFSLLPFGERAKFAHNGAAPGFSASAALYPFDDLVIVVLGNLGDVPMDALERELARRLFLQPPPDYRAVPIEPIAIDAWTGDYDFGAFPASFVREDGALHVRMPAPAPSARLRYIGDRTFVAETEPDVLQFQFEYRPEGRRVRKRMAGMLWYGDD